MCRDVLRILSPLDTAALVPHKPALRQMLGDFDADVRCEAK